MSIGESMNLFTTGFPGKFTKKLFRDLTIWINEALQFNVM